MAFLCGSSSAALALADSRSKENVLLTSANEQLMLAKSQLESEVQRLESEVQRLESEVQRLVQMDKPMTIEELDTNNKDERIAALEKKIEELDDTYSLGWAETSQTNADLVKENADLTKENEELRQILARARLEKVSGDEVIERNVAAMEETIESMQAEIYELHYFLGSKGYKARMLHAEGIRIPDEDAHAWWGFSACTRRNEDGTYSFFAHPDEEKTRPASMVNPNYGKQIRRYIRTY
jgi:regulator of replication initiation timing